MKIKFTGTNYEEIFKLCFPYVHIRCNPKDLKVNLIITDKNLKSRCIKVNDFIYIDSDLKISFNENY